MIDDALIRSANQLSRIYNPEPPLGGILYHYTNFAGLQGILESHKLRATYNKVLNDATEQVHAEAVISHELAQLGISWPKPTTQPKHFVTCFCESAKLLSMWRAYAGNCGGYCLGFEYSGLKNHMCWPDPKVGQSFPLLAPVHYGNTPESIRNYLIAAYCNGSRAVDQTQVLPHFFSSMIKHAAFEEEREWRIIALNPQVELLKFRSGTANIRPYVELSWLAPGKPRAVLPLVSVDFGPTLRSEDRPEEIIGRMLEKNGYTDALVRASNIPFRL